jgi:predicted nucleic acid-binding protein
MAVVVSDTTPLHYLILIGRDSVLQTLYGGIIEEQERGLQKGLGD